MRTRQIFSILLVNLLIVLIGCDKDDNKVTGPAEEHLESLSSPYLICASRNPGGVGFDFEYDGETGGANNMDALTVSDFTYDVKVSTIKAENPDQTLSGMPFFKLAADAKAINYSSVDTTCKGYTDYQNLTAASLDTFAFQSDDLTFDLLSLTPGSTGKPLMADVKNEYNKLVIGDKWKKAAKNDIADDEPVWIIQTLEGRQVKLIVPDFPADPAPTTTGYIEIEWDFID